MASVQLSLVNKFFRWCVKPQLRLTRRPAKARLDMELAGRFLFRKPPFTTVLSDDLDEFLSVGNCSSRRIILYFHGGGYVAGSPASHRGMLAQLSRLSGLRVVLPRYRLAPEHPAPAAFEDACAAHRRLLERGFHPGEIILGGDSAGGGLALALMAHLTGQGQAPAAGFFLSPWTDLALTGASLLRNATRDVILPVSRVHDLVEMVRGDCVPTDPRLSPLYADFVKPPPVQIYASKSEILWDDSRRMAERLRDCGGRVVLSAQEDAPHVWPILEGYVPEARATLKEIAAFIKQLP